MSNGDSLIGIVGAGHLGRALAKRAVSSGLHVLICNSRGPRTIAPLGRGVKAVSLAEAIEPEVVIIAIPWVRLAGAFVAVGDWEGRIVIDATNEDDPIIGGRSSSERVADLLPGAEVIKALNTLPAELFGTEPHSGKHVVFFAGDHHRARASVGRLIQHLGFSPIDLGDLAQGRLIEPHGPLARPLVDPR